MADRLQLLLEAEKRGILPPDKAPLLAEARKRGLVQQTDQAASIPQGDFAPGAGGYNPILGRVLGANTAVMNEAGMTPENVANPIANALGPLETLAQGGSAALALPISGAAGITQGVKNFLAKRGTPAADRVRSVQESLTYQPRTGMGSGFSRAVGAPSEIYQAATNRAGEAVTDFTGSPALGAAVKTVGDIAPAVVAARSGPRQAPVKRGTENYRSTKYDIPKTEELTAASREAYKAGKESGVMVAPEAYSKTLDGLQKMTKEEGLNPKLHPKSTAVMEELEKSAGKPLTLQEAETLRKIALDAEDDLNPVTRQPTPDARLASKIVDQLDDSIEALSVNNEARALWARSRRSQMIDQMIHRAEIRAGAHYTQAGMEHALRQEFKQLALNPRRMRGLTKEQRVAVEKVAKGGPLENSLRALGKFDPTSGGMSAFVSVGTGAALAPFTGGGSMALPAIGFGAKRAATKMTSRNVDKAREALVGRGSTVTPRPKAVATPPRAESKAGQPSIGSLSDVQTELQRLSPEARMEFLASELARLQSELAASRSGK